MTGGALPTLVFDATGNPKSMCNAFNYVGHTGRLVFVGIVTDDVSFPDPLLHRREMTVLRLAQRAARRLPPDHQADRRRADRHPARGSRTGPTSTDLIDDFPSYTKPETGVIKAMVEVG